MGDLFIRVLVKECQECGTLDTLVSRLKKLGIVLKWKNPEDEPSAKAKKPTKKKRKKKGAKANASVLEPCSLSGIQNVILLNGLDLDGTRAMCIILFFYGFILEIISSLSNSRKDKMDCSYCGAFYFFM